MTHKELCALAVAWLKRPSSRNGPGCLIAVAETMNFVNQEVPDAIGWRPCRGLDGGSVLVEVKTSRSDFLADRKKPHRISPVEGMGTFRYYMVPEGMVKPSELPERWGLVEVNARKHVKVVKGHVLEKGYGSDSLKQWRHENNQFAELCTLAYVLNRVGDPQKLQEQLRDASNTNARLVRLLEKSKERADRVVSRFGAAPVVAARG